MWVELGKIIVATGFEWLPKVQKIAQSGHTESNGHLYLCSWDTKLPLKSFTALMQLVKTFKYS